MSSHHGSDGSAVSVGIDAQVTGAIRWIAGVPCLPVHVPDVVATAGNSISGRYYLARCVDKPDSERTEWSLYVRRPLYGVQQRIPISEFDSEWLLHLPLDDDPGHRWLRRRAPGMTVHLLGPFGNGFSLPETAHNLLLLVDLTHDPGWLALLLSLIEPTLDHGGRVTLLLRAHTPLDEAALSHLPFAVEVQTATDESEWERSLAGAISWADQVCAGLPRARYAPLAQTIQSRRFRLEEGFCQVLVRADILCAVGACLACVVDTVNGGITRACTHGPVFDLTRLAS